MGVNVGLFIGDGVMLLYITEKIAYSITTALLIMSSDMSKCSIYPREKRPNYQGREMSFTRNKGLSNRKVALFYNPELKTSL